MVSKARWVGFHRHGALGQRFGLAGVLRQWDRLVAGRAGQAEVAQLRQLWLWRAETLGYASVRGQSGGAVSPKPPQGGLNTPGGSSPVCCPLGWVRCRFGGSSRPSCPVEQCSVAEARERALWAAIRAGFAQSRSPSVLARRQERGVK